MALQLLSEKDLPLVLAWRNNPEVRKNMYTSHEIGWDEHLAWFRGLQNDPSGLWYLYVRNTMPLGVVYFTSYQPKQGNAFWGFYAGADSPRGTGLRMEYDALEQAFSALKLHKLNCEVIGFNAAVINLHKKCGFKEEGVFRDFYYDGSHYHDVVRLGILDLEWQQHRTRLAERIAGLG